MIRQPSSVTQAEPRTVLLIDDDPALHHWVQCMLSSINVNMVSAYTGREGIQLARRCRPSLILLDYSMPDENGIEVLGRLKRESSLSTTPIVMMTGSEDRSLVTIAFENGVTDYVTKPIHTEAFKARVKSVFQKQDLLESLKSQINFDCLTGLLSRQRMAELITTKIAQKGEFHQSCAVLVVDLDRFKLINDSLGHVFGDLVIQAVSERLCDTMDSLLHCEQASGNTAVARLGGDKFVLFVESTGTMDDMQTFAQGVLTQIRQPLDIAGRALHLNATIGIVSDDAAYSCGEDILRDADIAMYAAKDSGRGRFQVFDKVMRDRVDQKWRLDLDLRIAIERNQFEMAYQPIINLQTNEVESVEALIRWNHPERGLVSPNEFIPLAEETGLILEISQWVAQAAFRQYADWNLDAPDATPNHVSINLSRQQLSQPDLCDEIVNLVRETGVDPSHIHFEITESQTMNDLESSLKTLSGLRQLGAKIDLDDFGTGHSSLSCLHELPIDLIKLDRSLIQEINHSKYFKNLASVVINLIEGTNIGVVAEGIETQDQLDTLRRLGCHFGQGYFFARPLKACEIPGFVIAQRRSKSRKLTQQSLNLWATGKRPVNAGVPILY